MGSFAMRALLVALCVGSLLLHQRDCLIGALESVEGGGTQLQGMLMEDELEEALRHETSAGLAAKHGGAMAPLLQRMEAVMSGGLSLKTHVEVRLVGFDGVLSPQELRMYLDALSSSMSGATHAESDDMKHDVVFSTVAINGGEGSLLRHVAHALWRSSSRNKKRW